MSTARTPTSLSSRLCPHEIRPLVARRREQMNNRVNRIHGWCASRRPPRPGASGRYGRRSAVPDEFSSGAAGSAAGAQRRRPLGLHEGQYVSGSDSSASPRSSLILYWCTAVLLVQACMVGPRKEMRPSAPLELRSSGSSAKIALNLGQSLVLCCSTRDVLVDDLVIMLWEGALSWMLSTIVRP